MQNLHLKNLNNTDPVECYFKELEKYKNEFEELTTEVIELYFEQNNPENNNKDIINILNNIDKKEDRTRQLKTKYEALAIVLLNHFLIELKNLNKLNQKQQNDNTFIKSYIDNINNNKEKYLNIEDLKNMKNFIDNLKTTLTNRELIIDILKYNI